MRRLTREKSLTEREFERLLIGAGSLNDPIDQLQARAAILIGGRLGMRPGEVVHLSSDWVNRRREMIHIPGHDPCTKGRDGGPCGYCKQAVKQQLKHDESKVFEDVLEDYWNPKTDAAVRDVPYRFSQRVGVAIEMLLKEFDGFPHSFSTLQRRLNESLDAAPDLNRESTTLHGLRATAASYHAGRGLDAGPLQSMFGWEDLSTARNYIAVDGEMTARALGEVHG
jgi:integrase